MLTAQETPLALMTASALAFVLLFHHLGAPPHGYQDMVGAVMIAAIAGPLGGWIFRAVVARAGSLLLLLPDVVERRVLACFLNALARFSSPHR
jgi:hypothetical protein